MPFYDATVKSVDGIKLSYPVPDVNKISLVKYKWNPENRGKRNAIHAEACFFYPDSIADSADIKQITETQFNNFAKVDVTVSKQKFMADGIDAPTIEATFPEGGGFATFVIITKDGKKSIEVTIDDSGKAVLPIDELKTSRKEVIDIRIRSKKWSTVSGFGGKQIEST